MRNRATSEENMFFDLTAFRRKEVGGRRKFCISFLLPPSSYLVTEAYL
jgi:hypothetical protein